MQNSITLFSEIKGVALCNFSLLYKNEDFSDVKFKIQDSIFPAHKCILAQRSDYFRTLFTGNFTEKQQEVIELKEISVDDFELCLSIIYGTVPDAADLDLDKALHILQVSCYFLIDDLVKIASDYLQKSLHCDSVLKIFANAVIFSLPNLLNSCSEMISLSQLTILEHDDFLQLPPKVLKEFISLDCLYLPEMEIFRAVQKWLEVNPDVESKQEILDSVRLGRMSEDELMNVVLPTNLYPSVKISETIAYSKLHPDQLLRGSLRKSRNFCTFAERHLNTFTFPMPFPCAFKKFEKEFKKLIYITLDLPDYFIINFFEINLKKFKYREPLYSKLNYSSRPIALEDLDKIEWRDADERCSSTRYDTFRTWFPETVVKYLRILVYQKEERPLRVERMECSYVEY